MPERIFKMRIAALTKHNFTEPTEPQIKAIPAVSMKRTSLVEIRSGGSMIKI